MLRTPTVTTTIEGEEVMPATRWSKWFWSDWMNDKGLRVCSYAARGLWIDMLAIMAESEKVGYLMIAGRPLTPEGLARATGGSPEEVSALLAELEAAQVFSRDNAKKIYSRRLVRDEKKRRASSEGGKAGGPASLEKKTGIHATRGDDSEPDPESPSERDRDLTRASPAGVQSPESRKKEDDVVEQIPEPRAQLDPAYRPDWAKRDLRRVSNGNIDETSAGITDLSPIEAMLADGADWELDVLEIVRTDVRALRQPMRSWRAPWFRQAVFERRAERLRGQGVVVLDTPIERRERERIDADRLAARKTIAKLWLETGYWPDACGVEPPRNEEFPIAFLEQVADANGLKLSTRLPASILRKVPPV